MRTFKTTKAAARQTIKDARNWSEVPFAVQPDPRWPLHYKFRARLVQVDGEATATFQVATQPVKHYWSWSPLFWWNIFMAWVRPEKEEIDEDC